MAKAADCETCKNALWDYECFYPGVYPMTGACEYFVSGCQIGREPADDCSDYQEGE